MSWFAIPSHSQVRTQNKSRLEHTDAAHPFPWRLLVEAALRVSPLALAQWVRYPRLSEAFFGWNFTFLFRSPGTWQNGPCVCCTLPRNGLVVLRWWILVVPWGSDLSNIFAIHQTFANSWGLHWMNFCSNVCWFCCFLMWTWPVYLWFGRSSFCCFFSPFVSFFLCSSDCCSYFSILYCFS